MKFRLSKLADEDLLGIFVYTLDEWGVEQLVRYKSLLEAGRDEIVKDPLCAGSKAREDLAKGCRVFRVGEHYLVYRVKNGIVEIGRILHGRMDFESRMSSDVFEDCDG